MSNTEKQDTSNNDEIDLKELFQSIGNFFKNILTSVMMFFVHFRNATVKNIRLIVILGVLGGLSGIALNFIIEEYYTTSMVLKSTHLTGRLMESSIEKLNQLSEEDDPTQLAKVLNISPEVADKVKSFDFEPFISEDEVVSLEVFKEQLKAEIEDEETINKFVDKLKSENRNTYRISVAVYDNTVINELEDPIINYFKNNLYVRKRLDITRTNLELEVQNINDELKKLDSLKDITFRNLDFLASSSRSGSNNVILSDEKMANPIEVINQSREKYRDLLNVNRRLFLGEDFELIDGFIAYSKPDSPNLLEFGFFSGLVGLGLAYLILLFSALNGYLNRIEEQNKKALN